MDHFLAQSSNLATYEILIGILKQMKPSQRFKVSSFTFIHHKLMIDRETPELMDS